MSPDFEKWNDRYSKGWANKDQIMRLVVLGRLTEEEYKIITGEDYPTQ